jgi:hypothetical protein
MSATLDKIIEEGRALSPEEQRQLREQLETIIPSSPTEDELEDAFERELMAEGVIGPVKPLTATDEEMQQYQAYKPITVEGQPLSEMIIEERR